MSCHRNVLLIFNLVTHCRYELGANIVTEHLGSRQVIPITMLLARSRNCQLVQTGNASARFIGQGGHVREQNARKGRRLFFLSFFRVFKSREKKKKTRRLRYFRVLRWHPLPIRLALGTSEPDRLINLAPS